MYNFEKFVEMMRLGVWIDIKRARSGRLKYWVGRANLKIMWA